MIELLRHQRYHLKPELATGRDILSIFQKLDIADLLLYTSLSAKILG
jgi:hypothetical protein